MHACARNIKDAKTFMQSTCVRIRLVQNNSHKDVCMSVTYVYDGYMLYDGYMCYVCMLCVCIQV